MMRKIVFLSVLLVYNIAITFALPFVVLYFCWRSIKDPIYARDFDQRLGFVRTSSLKKIGDQKNEVGGGRVLLHCASVGEVNAADPLVKKMLVDGVVEKLIVSTMTPTGADRAKRLWGRSMAHNFIPLDWPPCVWLFFLRVRPGAVLIVERELWPNFLFACHCLSIPVLVVNARMSSRSFESYRRFRWLFKPILRGVTVAAQTESDAKNYCELGVVPKRCSVTGSLKHDVTISAQEREQFRQWHDRIAAFGGRGVWIAASTHNGEDQIVIDAHKLVLARHPDSLLVIVPRHPERFDSVAKHVASRELQCQRSGEGGPVKASTSVLLIDQMGELFVLYGVADVAFVGGSLVPVGGHNVLEPALWGKPLLSGPHVHNFSAIDNDLRALGVLLHVDNAQMLSEAVLRMFEQPDQARSLGETARAYVDGKRGAVGKTLALVSQLQREC